MPTPIYGKKNHTSVRVTPIFCVIQVKRYMYNLKFTIYD